MSQDGGGDRASAAAPARAGTSEGASAAGRDTDREGAPEPGGDDSPAGPPALDPSVISLHRGPTGSLRLGTPDRSYLRVSCYRAYPLSAPDEWIVLFDGAGAHIGVLPAVDALDAASAALCREELEFRYVVPLVRDVLALREEVAESRWNPALVWDVDTARGRLRLHLPNLQDHVRPLGPGRLLLTDRDGRRCVLEPGALTGHSRALVARYLWLEPQPPSGSAG